MKTDKTRHNKKPRAHCVNFGTYLVWMPSNGAR